MSTPPLSPRLLEASPSMVINPLDPNHEIFELCDQNNWDEVGFKVQQKSFDRMALDRNGLTVLMRAVLSKATTVISRWPKDDPSVNAVDISGKTAAHYAASCADSEIWTELVNIGVNVTIPDKQGFLPLHYAAMRDDAILFYLIAGEKCLRVDVVSTDATQCTPLHLLCENMQYPPGLIPHLHKEGASLTRLNGAGRTPLVIALEKRNTGAAIDILNCIQEKGTQAERDLINQANPARQTPLYLATERRMSPVVEELVHMGAKVDEGADHVSPLYIAICHYLWSYESMEKESSSDKLREHVENMRSFWEIIVLLLKSGANPDLGDQQQTPLYRACVANHCELATLLCDSKATIHRGTSQETPIQALKRLRRQSPTKPWMHLITLLEGRGADETIPPQQPTSKTAPSKITLKMGNKLVPFDLSRKALLEPSKDRDLHNDTPLHVICSNANYFSLLENCLALLTSKNDCEQRNSKGHTLLLSACFGGNCAAVKRLFAASVNVAVKDHQNNNIYHAAAVSGNASLLRFLLEQSTKHPELAPLTNQTNQHGHPPLITALACGQGTLVALFLLFGCDPNVNLSLKEDGEGRTTSALHYAVHHVKDPEKLSDVVGVLLKSKKKKADAYARNRLHETPLGLAYNLRRLVAIKAMLACGVNSKEVFPETGYSLLQQASCDGWNELITILLGDKKTSLDEDPSPLLLASRAGQSQTVELLLTSDKFNVKKKSKKGTPLTVTVREHCLHPTEDRFYRVAQLILSRLSKEDVDDTIKVTKDLERKKRTGSKTKTNKVSEKMTALRVACEFGATQYMVALLLDKGASPNHGSFPQRSVLATACKKSIEMTSSSTPPEEPYAVVNTLLQFSARFFKEEKWPSSCPQALEELLKSRLSKLIGDPQTSMKWREKVNSRLSTLVKLKPKKDKDITRPRNLSLVSPGSAAAAATASSTTNSEMEEDDLVSTWGFKDEMSVTDLSSISDVSPRHRSMRTDVK